MNEEAKTAPAQVPGAAVGTSEVKITEAAVTAAPAVGKPAEKPVASEPVKTATATVAAPAPAVAPAASVQAAPAVAPVAPQPQVATAPAAAPIVGQTPAAPAAGTVPVQPGAPTPESMKMVMHDITAPIITMKKLLEAGVHFGHQTRKWNPKMSKYIYGARNGIYIIDLVKSAAKIGEAYLALKKIVDENGKVLFVGVKQQCRDIVEEQALRSGSFYVNNRWLGGTLTNFKTIQTRIRHLKDLEAEEADGAFDKMPKKEAAILRKEKDKLARNLEGIKEMRKLPNALVVVDPENERIAVLEARKLRIPVFGIADTNSDPDQLDYPIPANDDAVRSVKLVMTVLADAIVESKGGITEIAYTKDEGPEVTMKDAIRQADKENAERLAAIRKARQERQERYEKMQAQRALKRKKEMEAAKAAAENKATGTSTDTAKTEAEKRKSILDF